MGCGGYLLKRGEGAAGLLEGSIIHCGGTNAVFLDWNEWIFAQGLLEIIFKSVLIPNVLLYDFWLICLMISVLFKKGTPNLHYLLSLMLFKYHGIL